MFFQFMQIWFCFTYLEDIWILLINWRLRNSLYLRTLAGCFWSGAVAQTVEMFATNLACLKWKSSILMQACSCSSSSSLVSWWLLPVPPLPYPLGVPGQGLLEPFLVTAVAVASKCCLQQPSPTNLVRSVWKVFYGHLANASSHYKHEKTMRVKRISLHLGVAVGQADEEPDSVFQLPNQALSLGQVVAAQTSIWVIWTPKSQTEKMGTLVEACSGQESPALLGEQSSHTKSWCLKIW